MAPSQSLSFPSQISGAPGVCLRIRVVTIVAHADRIITDEAVAVSIPVKGIAAAVPIDLITELFGDWMDAGFPVIAVITAAQFL